jgi:hypothetical protein
MRTIVVAVSYGEQAWLDAAQQCAQTMLSDSLSTFVELGVGTRRLDAQTSHCPGDGVERQ